MFTHVVHKFCVCVRWFVCVNVKCVYILLYFIVFVHNQTIHNAEK